MKSKIFLIIVCILLSINFIYALDCSGELSIDSCMMYDEGDCPNYYYYDDIPGKYYQCVWELGICEQLEECTFNPSPSGLVNTPPYFYNVTVNFTNYGFPQNTFNFSSYVTDRETNPINAQLYINNNLTHIDDESQNSASSSKILSFGGPKEWGNTFTPDEDGYVYEACIPIRKPSVNLYDVVVEIHDVNQGSYLPYYNVLTNATISRLDITTDTNPANNWHCVNFSDTVYVEKNTLYAITVRTSYSGAPTTSYNLYYESNLYSDGVLLYKPSSPWAWSTYLIYDLAFNVSIGNFSKVEINDWQGITVKDYFLSDIEYFSYGRKITDPYYMEWCAEDSQGGNKCYIYDLFISATYQNESVPPTAEILYPENNSIVNGVVIIDGDASDNYAIKSTRMMYNASAGWTNLPGCDLLDESFDCYWDIQNTTLWQGKYQVYMEACDFTSCVNSSTYTYEIDNRLPIVKTRNTYYSVGDYSAKNGDTVTLKMNVTDNDTAIDSAFVNLTLLNGTGIVPMLFESGNESARNFSTWNISTIINSNADGYNLIYFYVNDSSTPQNQRVDAFVVRIDNQAPTWNETGVFPNPLFNGTTATFSIHMYDNFRLRNFLFSHNQTGSWVNESFIPISSDYEDTYKSVFLNVTEGNFSYYFTIFDDANNSNMTTIQDVEVLGPEPVLDVKLVYPNNGDILTFTNINFTFNYTTVSTNATECRLYIDDVLNNSVENPDANINYTFETNLDDFETYEWMVTCENSYGINYSSVSYSLTINSSYSPPKDGLVSTVVGTIPYYTNKTSNPFNISLDVNESVLVTFWVNATGAVGQKDEFFVYANLSSNQSISNTTQTWNVTIISGAQVCDINLVAEEIWKYSNGKYVDSLTEQSCTSIPINASNGQVIWEYAGAEGRYVGGVASSYEVTTVADDTIIHGCNITDVAISMWCYDGPREINGVMQETLPINESDSGNYIWNFVKELRSVTGISF